MRWRSAAARRARGVVPAAALAVLATVLATALATALAACGAEDPADASGDPPASQPSTEEAEPTEEAEGDDGGSAGPSAEEAAVEVEIEIEDGEVTPAGAQVDAAVGDTVLLQVDSDVPEQLHVHSSPEQTFTVEAADDQTFRFTVERPGQVGVELHESGVLVAELVVQP